MSVFVHDFDEHTAIVTDFHHLGVEEQFPLVVVDGTFLSQSEIVFFSELLRCFVLRCRRNRGACISPFLLVLLLVLTRIVLQCRRNRGACISPFLVVLTRIVLRCRRNRGACISPCLVVLTRIVLRCRRNRDTCISPCLVVLTRIPADTGGSAREGQHGRVSTGGSVWFLHVVCLVDALFWGLLNGAACRRNRLVSRLDRPACRCLPFLFDRIL